MKNGLKLSTFKDNFPYRMSRLGLLPATPVPGINKILNNLKETVFHREVKFCNDSDYSDVLVAIIKMGGNVSIKDVNSKKPLEYITSQEKLNDVLNNLNKTLNNYNKDNNIIGLRLQRAKIELSKDNDREIATNEYILRLQKCMNTLLNGNIKKFNDNIPLFKQFLIEENDEDLQNKVHNVIVDFFKQDNSEDFEDKLNNFINNTNTPKLQPLFIALLDVGYTKATSQEIQLDYLKKLAVNYYPNNDLKQQIVDKFNYQKEHITNSNIETLNNIEKIITHKKLYNVKEHVEPLWKDDSSSVSPKKYVPKVKTKTKSNVPKAKNIIPKKDAKEQTVVANEVLGTEKFSKNIKKLSPEVQDGIQKAIDALNSGDTSGLNAHRLTGNRAGQLAIDVKNTGGGRGKGRLIYTEDKKNNTIKIEEFLSKHDY